MSQLTPEPEAGDGVIPVIPLGSNSNWTMWAFFALLPMGGLLLFSALNAREEAIDAPSVLAPTEEVGTRIASPRPLAIPERFREMEQPSERQDDEAQSNRAIEPAIRAYTPPERVLPDFSYLRESIPSVATSNNQEESTDPRVVFEARPLASGATDLDAAADDVDRVSASRFLNPGFTIPQGTVIPAVLETALDSTRAGGARALIQRDVSSFDGTRVLIPRGSRLYGEYEGDLERGQNRALVQWTRLIRPDGVTIALDSPSSDPLGRAGVKGKVDSKFLQRFGGAILQSILDIGVGLAVNQVADGVIVALPGSVQNLQVTDPSAVTPTLKVKHGTSVSVFVARDLDFSTVDS